MPPKAKKKSGKAPPASTVPPSPSPKGVTAAKVVRGRGRPRKNVAVAETVEGESLPISFSTPPSTTTSAPSKDSPSNRPPPSPQIPTTSVLPGTESPSEQPASLSTRETDTATSARCRPYTFKMPRPSPRVVDHPQSRPGTESRINPRTGSLFRQATEPRSEVRSCSDPRYLSGTDPRFRPRPLHRIPVRAMQMLAPDLLPDAPIRLPSPPPSSHSVSALECAAQEKDAPAASTAVRQQEETEETTTDKGPIKLREGWGYKIGETKWRAVYDPNRKSIPKLPLRGSVETTGTEDGSTGKTPVYITLDPIPEPPVEEPKPKPGKKLLDYDNWPRPKSVMDYFRQRNREAAQTVKKCYDERMAEEASSSSTPPPTLGALIRIVSEEAVQLPSEHVYTHPECVHTAEIITTFPLDQLAHYRKKKYKDDHVVIGNSDLDEIYVIINRMRDNKRKWARIKARAAVDEEYKAKLVEKKARAQAAEKAKMAALSKEERRLLNVRKYAYEKAKRLEQDPEKLAKYENPLKKQRLEERRQANLARNKALLEAGVDDPEERRRIQRRIRAAERTPEERRAWNRRDTEYVIRKKERMKNLSPEELARLEEEKRVRKEKKAALAQLTPKERMRVQQREYVSRHKAKKQGRVEKTGEESTSPVKGPVRKKRRVETKKEERVVEMDMMEVEDDHFGFGDEGGADEYEENQLAVQSISSPSPTRPSRHVPPHRHNLSHEDDDDVIEIAGPSSSRRHLQQQQRYEGDIEAELIQLQKDVVWSDRAIHNSRVEVDRLREEADNLESAIDDEQRTQMERKRRIAQLTAIWREEHGEDSQG